MPAEPSVIRKNVREFFNESADSYEQFEKKFKLYSYLSAKLATVCNIQKGMRVADIGCGTGISSFELQKIVGIEGTVTGFDSSENMLEIAQLKLKGAEGINIKFIHSDASGFNAHIDSKLDAVLYNAAISLVPEPLQTLKAAYEALKEDGTVGMNYLMGLYNDNNDEKDYSSPSDDLFRQAKKDGRSFAPYGRDITDSSALPGMLVNIGFRDVRKGILVKKIDIDTVKAFYTVPAPSAGLWPRHGYEERLSLLESLIEYFQEQKINTCDQIWGWCCAMK